MIDYKKDYKEIYGALKRVRKVLKPAQNFISVTGQGDPNTSSDFNSNIAKLYKFMYFIKMSYKKNYVISNFEQFKVFPLEGLWTGQLDDNQKVIKSTMVYNLMIALPEFITEDVFTYYFNKFQEVNPDFDIQTVNFLHKPQHLVVSGMHVGPFDTEIETFTKINEFIKQNDLQRIDKRWHKEIYLSDFRRVSEDKYKTILVVEVRENKNTY